MSTDSDLSPAAGDGLPLALIERYWLGETSPADATRVEAWFRTHPEQRTVYASLGAKFTTDDFPVRTSSAWAEQKAAILAASSRSGIANTRDVLTFPQRPVQETAGLAGQATVRKLFMSRPRTRRVLYAFLRTTGVGAVAGAVILLAVMSGVVWRFAARDTMGAVAPSGGAAMREYRTARGQRATIHLADGTKVVLAPETRLRVPGTIGDLSASTNEIVRQVVLEGEAYFDVVHDERHLFSVRTAAGIARDIGTEFNVRAYPETRGMQVAVVSGIVALHAPPRTGNSSAALSSAAPLATLRGGDRALLSITGAMTMDRGVDLSAATAWTSGHLVFAGTPVPDVMLALSRWYDLDIRLVDATPVTRRLALTLRDEPASVALNLVALALDLRIERQGHVVTFLPLHAR